jgi:uncharacterized protein (DUF427 family)
MIRPVLKPGPSHRITVTPYRGRVIVARDGVVLADTRAALQLQEASYPPVLYVPREDADLALLEPTDHHTYCPYKGDASYFTIRAGDEPVENGVWSYEHPHDDVAGIAGHLAFYPQHVELREGAGEAVD